MSPAVKSVGKPDALIGHVRFDERGRETGDGKAQAAASFLDSTSLFSGLGLPVLWNCHLATAL